MVRTLVFHSKNVGSNPASLNMRIHSKLSNKLHKHSHSVKTLHSSSDRRLRSNTKYSLRFASIIAPGKVSNFSLTARSNPSASSKLQVKQSYMLMTWMSYVQANTFDTKRIATRPSFFVQPVVRSRMTLLKAPMAHKTFSQEQYSFKSYILVITFDGRGSSAFPSSVNRSIFVASSVRQFDTSMETNLLVLSRFRISFASEDSKFVALN